MDGITFSQWLADYWGYIHGHPVSAPPCNMGALCL